MKVFILQSFVEIVSVYSKNCSIELTLCLNDITFLIRFTLSFGWRTNCRKCFPFHTSKQLTEALLLRYGILIWGKKMFVAFCWHFVTFSELTLICFSFVEQNKYLCNNLLVMGKWTNSQVSESCARITQCKEAVSNVLKCQLSSNKSPG